MSKSSKVSRYGGWKLVAILLSLTTWASLTLEAWAAPHEFKHDWKIQKPFPQEPMHLDVVISTKRTGMKKDSSRFLLSIYSNNTALYVGDDNEESEPVQVSSIDGGKIAVVWFGPGPYYRIDAFALKDGKVRQVLRAGSKLHPEIVYPDTPASMRDGYLCIDPIIITCSNIRNVVNGFKPIDADVWHWDQKVFKYVSKKEPVPWGKRFSP